MNLEVEKEGDYKQLLLWSFSVGRTLGLQHRCEGVWESCLDCICRENSAFIDLVCQSELQALMKIVRKGLIPHSYSSWCRRHYEGIWQNFPHSFITYLFSTYGVPGILLDTGHITGNKIKSLFSRYSSSFQTNKCVIFQVMVNTKMGSEAQ